MNHEDLLEKYHSAATAFINAAKELPSTTLQQSHEGQWSAAFVIHHITDAELQFGARYANALAEDNPAIIPFDEEKFPSALHYESRPVDVSLSAFSALHQLNYETLKNIDSKSWDRTSNHPERGAVKLFDLVLLSADHIDGHIAQLKDAAK